MIPPAGVTGLTILDVVAQSTRLWSQLLSAPMARLDSTPPALALPAPPQPLVEQVTTVTATDGPVTDHALLVLLGQFAQHLGLVDLLAAVPIAQKTVEHRPQTKLIQFLIGILAGMDYLQEFNDAPNPLVRDIAVQRAWGQPAFAHYSGVSRTLAATTEATLQAVVAALQQVSRPFLEREVLAIVRSNQPLTVDIDLTGRGVSPTSSDYPEAAFGWMDNAVAKGYQAAISSLSGGPSGRVLLSSQRYAGRAKSADCLQAAIRQVEQTLGLHPRRRTALVQARLSALAASLAERQQALLTLRTQPATARSQARLAKLVQQVASIQAQQETLTAELRQLESDNAHVPSIVTVVIRLDAGFATDAILAWLIEMGYTVLTKAHSGHTTSRLQRSIAADAAWRRVGANAEAVALGERRIGDGRYALEALQVRYQLPEGLRHTTLLYYGDLPPPAPAEWFEQYNRRQVLEAGIKENKGVFTMRRPLVRSPIGMQLQAQFAVFAANLVRWAAAWAREQLQDVPAALAQALREVKTLVRVVAHSRARLVETPVGCALVFDPHSPFGGAVLIIRGQAVFQNVLPLFTIGATTPRGVT
jgi:hypothetical protein